MDFGTVTKFTDTLRKSLGSTPIASQTSARTMVIETGASLTYNVEFSTQSGHNIQRDELGRPVMVDKATVPIRLEPWCDSVTALVDRWQAKTDGCRLTYNVASVDTTSSRPKVKPVNPKVPCIYRQNVFIKSLSLSYAAGKPDCIEGHMTLSVGGLAKVHASGAPKTYMSTEYDIVYE